jgi:transcriptional regulator with XRE-family HTH domain
MKMKKLVNLKSTLFENGKTMSELSKETGIPRAYLSLACSGRMLLSDDEKAAIARNLKKTVSELFA